MNWATIVFTLAETFEVRNALRRLEAEAEVGSCRGQPAVKHFCSGQRSEGVVDLDRGELCRVELEEALRRCAGGIELRLPGWIGPSPTSRHKDAQTMLSAGLGRREAKLGPQCVGMREVWGG